jgi:hypothetical protein
MRYGMFSRQRWAVFTKEFGKGAGKKNGNCDSP